MKTTALGHAALKTGWSASPVKCSFTARKVERDSERFRLFLPCLTFARYVFTRPDLSAFSFFL